MKIFSSSPYATFNPKEWKSLSRTNANHKFTDNPIKIKKGYFSSFKNIKTKKIALDDSNLPRQIKLAFN